MTDFIPAFDFQQVVIEPWTLSFESTLAIVLMGFFVTASCGLVGHYLLLRRMALIGDAISHSILPGLVMVFVVFKTTSLWASMLGALTAGMATVVLIEFIHHHSRVKPDAAICIVFTTFFALGVAMMSVLESQGGIHLDAECVLYGEIAYVAFEPPVEFAGLTLPPAPVIRMAVIFGVLIGLIHLFYKELLITSFDAGLAAALGLRTSLWHYGLMGVLALVIVSAFEAVGAILAVAMLIVPPMVGAQLSDQLPRRMALTVVHAALSAVLGMHLAVWLNCTTAGAMVVVGSALFVLAWSGSLLRQRFIHIAASEPPPLRAA